MYMRLKVLFAAVQKLQQRMKARELGAQPVRKGLVVCAKAGYQRFKVRKCTLQQCRRIDR